MLHEREPHEREREPIPSGCWVRRRLHDVDAGDQGPGCDSCPHKEKCPFESGLRLIDVLVP